MIGAGLGTAGLWADGHRSLLLLAGVEALVTVGLILAARGDRAVGGRILTLMAGVLLLIAAVPGWLQAQQPPPWQWRRVGWAVEPDPAMIRVTDRIKEWQREGGMEHGGRWFNDSPAVLPFLAWYCPGELGWMDAVRLPLYDDKTVQDFKQVRESLGKTKAGDAGKQARDLLHSRDAQFLICYEADPLEAHSPLPTLLAAPQEWPLLYTDGRASVFGWRDPAKDQPPQGPPLTAGAVAAGLETAPTGALLAAADLVGDPFVRYEVPAEREAFGPLTAPTLAAAEPPAQEWWTMLWTPETPRPLEADEAAVQLLRFEMLQPVWRKKTRRHGTVCGMN